MIRARHTAHLSAALGDVLGVPTSGDVAFLRCLPSELLDALIDQSNFDVPGWSVTAVVDVNGPRRITADEAVERREDKAAPTLFLIDPLRAGAGLDGIYSAGREIDEAMLFRNAQDQAKRALRGKLGVLAAAQRRATRLGRRHRLTPWQVFDFLVAAEEGGVGAALTRLGLWPIAGDGLPDDNALDLSAALADRLLFSQDTRSLGDRVRGLLLHDANGEQGAALERFLRSVAGRSPLQAAADVLQHPCLWLGPLQPRFSGESLQSIRPVSWRGPRGAVARWSGLLDPEEDEGKPRLLLDRAASMKAQGRLEVRWVTEPDQLAKGTAEYRITVIAGDEELAEQVISHKEKGPQRAVFSLEEFEDLDADAKFEAFVQIAPIGVEGVDAQRTEEFVLEFGHVSGRASASSGQIVRTLADGAIAIGGRAEFDEAIAEGHLPPRVTEDRKGFISWRGKGSRSVRVLRPALIRQIEEDWRERKGTIGRWIVRVRADGSPAGAPSFQPIDRGACEPRPWDSVVDASRKVAADLGPFGLLARVQGARWQAGDAYLTAWTAALDLGPAEFALHGTVEVQALSGRTIGLIVTPLHPLRVAWQGVYDRLAAHARYEEGLPVGAVQRALKALDSAHFPATLPGVQPGSGFVFADMLGFQAVAMTRDGEPEPKAAVALMVACLSGGQQTIAPLAASGSASALAREIRHYLDCQQGRGGDRSTVPALLNLQAWRPGDGMTVARALGEVLGELDKAPDDQEEDDESMLCFTLDLFEPGGSAQASGGFLSDVGRRRRAGGGVLDARDRWMTETARRPGDIVVPRLRWSRRREDALPSPAHMSLAFDVFQSRLEARPAGKLCEEARPLHAFGLSKALERRTSQEGELEWTMFAPPRLEGERAPDNRAGTDRLLRLDSAVARATTRFLGGGAEDWPVLTTRLPHGGRSWIDLLHDRSDWVVTVDRNACIEYFDAPRRRPDVYERFLIDAVPERSDLSSLQLITSTSNLDAVRDLVDEALGDMGLSSSERNSRFLLEELKALSGRLAIRLANPAGRTGELIALALMQGHCARTEENPEIWLDLTQGFFVPADEILDLVPIVGPDGSVGSEGGRRADFIHVRAPSRGPLEFRFVEVKHRRHLRTARQPDMLQGILAQTGDLRRRWHTYFFAADMKPAERALRRSQLARILFFYADRAARHRLTSEAHARLRREIDQVLLRETYQPADIDQPDIGYVFCPEHRAGRPEPLYATGGDEARLWLFGPGLLPDKQAVDGGIPASSFQGSTEGGGTEAPAADGVTEAEADGGGDELTRTPEGMPQPASDATVDVVLGTAVGGVDEIAWRASIRGNPHLLIVGLPGMGKTTCLIDICRQLAAGGIAPVVFSYHDDIDAQLIANFRDVQFVDYHGLGFNPLRVDADQPTAHIDVAGALRDIFASIFPDLGDLQLEELRQAIRLSYENVGWGNRGVVGSDRLIPPFGGFLDILRAKAKPNPGLLARLQELADYGFFEAAGERASLLDSAQPTIVRVHSTNNAMLQNAFSSFVLYSLYKDMFRRGVQNRLTHAVIFDEAHRAARLKLIPQFAKECRKFGLAFALASQEAKDFSTSLFSAVGNYLALRVTEADARTLARMTGSAADEKRTADRIKALARYTAVFFGEGYIRPVTVRLGHDPT